MPNGDNTFSLEELDQLLNEEDEQATPPATGNTAGSASQPVSDDIEKTQAFSRRLRERTEKAVADERESISKSLGYESYDAMMKSREEKMLKDNGLNPEDVMPAVEKLVQERLNNDPRMKELEKYREREVQEFAKRELEELSRLTDGEITSMDKVPADVIARWRETGSLKKAYIELHGEDLVIKARNAAARGTTQHLQSAGDVGRAPEKKGRPLTEEEKAVWRFFNRGITDEELNKKFVED